MRGPKSLEIAARLAEGTVLADFVSAEYIEWVRDIVGPDHRLTVFTSLAMGPTIAHQDIRRSMAGYLAEVAHGGVSNGVPMSLQKASFFDELASRATETSWFEAAVAMPDDWWTQVLPFGLPEQAASYVHSIVEAGAHAVIFFPDPADPADATALAAEQLMPLL